MFLHYSSLMSYALLRLLLTMLQTDARIVQSYRTKTRRLSFSSPDQYHCSARMHIFTQKHCYSPVLFRKADLITLYLNLAHLTSSRLYNVVKQVRQEEISPEELNALQKISKTL